VPSSAEAAVPAVIPKPPDPTEAALRAALNVILVQKRLIPKDVSANRFNAQEAFSFRYVNRSEKDIRAFTGYVTFSDLFDREFLRISLTSEARIPSGESRSEDRSIELDQFSQEHGRLASTALEDLKVKFEPASVLFSDGTQLGSAK
jgi:hypothetical protein